MEKRRFIIEFGKTQDHSIDYLLGILEDARITTLQAIANIPTAEIDWQFQEGWNTIGALLAHITAIEHYFRIEFVEGRKLTDEENNQWLPGMEMGPYLPQLIKKQPTDAYIIELKESRRMLMEALQKITFTNFVKRIEDYDPVTGCNLAWALYHMVEDEIYHRGQISIIRKLYKSHHSNPNFKVVDF
ncbi:DinB family protein [Adhaeribacter radiodurans]|uniref:DinB family protein n=1 Tax=Adhaeribacter radiodurans TaxID=2745197 RepID=A0A7L7LFD9_9BACT|nr:DinB family protein [Adhaeribacter radiodurans]QMU31397.1 DinB family protein [Adhaeribacter radiodurans]